MDFIDQIAASIRDENADADETDIIEVACAMASAVENGFVSCTGMNQFSLSARGVRFVESLLETDESLGLFQQVIGVAYDAQTRS